VGVINTNNIDDILADLGNTRAEMKYNSPGSFVEYYSKNIEEYKIL
jgi:hypothetical protein